MNGLKCSICNERLVINSFVVARKDGNHISGLAHASCSVREEIMNPNNQADLLCSFDVNSSQ